MFLPSISITESWESRPESLVEKASISLLPRLLSKDLLVFYSGKSEHFNPDYPWYFLSFPKGEELSLYFSPEVSSYFGGQYYEVLLSLTKGLSESFNEEQSLKPVFQESLLKDRPAKQHIFDLYYAKKRLEYIGEMRVAGNSFETLYQATKGRKSCTSALRLASTDIQLELLVSVGGCQINLGKIVQASTVVLNPGSLLLKSPLASGVDLFRGNLESVEKGIRITVMESVMEAEQFGEVNIGATVSLGAIEMSLEDLLSLRPGMSIEFEKPDLFESILQVGGADFAQVELVLEESRIVMMVKNIISLKKNEPSRKLLHEMHE